MRVLILGGINITPTILYQLRDDLFKDNHSADVVLWSEVSRLKRKRLSYSYLDYFAEYVKDLVSNVDYDYIITETIASNVLIRILNEIDEYINVIMISPSYYKTIRGKLRLASFFHRFSMYSVMYFKAQLAHKWKHIELMRPRTASCVYMEAFGDRYMIQSFSTNHIYIIRGSRDDVIPSKNINLLRDSLVVTEEFIIDGEYSLLKTRYRDTYNSILYILYHTWDAY